MNGLRGTVIRRLLFLGAVCLVGAACGSAPSPTASPSSAIASPTVESTSPSSGVARTTLSGTGGKRGFPVELAGDYHVTGFVKAKRGCTWALSIPPKQGQVESIKSNAGRQRVEVASVSIDPGAYRLTVSAAHCGPWSVTLTRR